MLINVKHVEFKKEKRETRKDVFPSIFWGGQSKVSTRLAVVDYKITFSAAL